MMSSGSLSPRIKWKEISNYELHLPPIEEQKKIVKALERFEEISKGLRGKLDVFNEKLNSLQTSIANDSLV